MCGERVRGVRCERRGDQMAEEHDVIVVGGGPAGAATAYYLARAGIDVLVLEKAAFPRDKICGDGLTPRAVAELHRMGINTSAWVKNFGLRTYGGGHTVEVPWPELASMPNYGLACPRRELDSTLIQRAVSAGAQLREGVNVTAPIRSERTGRVAGVVATQARKGGELRFTSRYVVDAGGVSARLATAMGRQKKMNRPMGVAYRTYFQSPHADIDMMESHLELWEGEPHASDLMPGYGWIFAVGDGLVNVGLGSLSSTAAPTGLDYRAMFHTWMKNVLPEWGFTEENQVGQLRGAALPMAFNRTPHYADGLLLVGDAGGMVSPFNGEGIAYALQSGRCAADAINQALHRPTITSEEAALAQYPRLMRQELGGYYTLGRIFAALIERPEIMHLCVQYGLPRPTLMRLVMKLLSDSYDRADGDWMDKLITGLTKAVPRA